MKTNDTMHGFTVRYVQEIPELKARLVRMEYTKNHADLVWLDREDDNKTFAIAFKTIPSDDTGIFHILEHSVLSGSKKYPVKEPFVELIKSSLNTFLNAFTFPDKTMYPVCSRNNQDFLNLIDVYMDAVLHPLSVYNPQAFLQEGWHYEMENADADLTINGVVYSEMKGAFASSDEVLSTEMDGLLFPDNCYGYCSGGHPAHIPELTYESYLANHKRFYHPSNSRIFLDGSVDMDSVLCKLDAFLSEYDALDVDADIPMQTPVTPAPKTCLYEIGQEDDESNKTILSTGWVFAKYDESAKILAMSALAQVLCGSNDSPFKKEILEKGLADDVEFSVLDGIQQPYMLLVVRNLKQENEAQIRQILTDTIKAQAENGVDHEQLKAVLGKMEFQAREKDYGSMPRGLAYGILAQQGWLYGGDPAQDLTSYKHFADLLQKVDEGWFEALMKETMIDNPHTASLTMLPSKTIGAERQANEAKRLADLKASWSKEQIAETVEAFHNFRALQNEPDSAEAKASLPLLSLSDIPEEIVPTKQNVLCKNGITVLHQPIETDGIVYLNLYFSLRDFSMQDLSKVAFLSGLFGQIDTEHYDALSLSTEMDSVFGMFHADTVVMGLSGGIHAGEPYLAVMMSVLESKLPQVSALLDEVLNRTTFADSNQIASILRQSHIGLEQRMIMSGNAYAAQRAAATYNIAAALGDRMGGISYLRALQEWDKGMGENGAAMAESLKAAAKKLFIKERMTISVTGKYDEAEIEKIAAVFANGEVGANAEYSLLPKKNEGYTIPAEIGFAAKCGNIADFDSLSNGAFKVASQFLTYDYLWTEVRVKGGAYGTGMRVGVSGSVNFTSYRDPNAARSLSIYNGAADALRALCDDPDGFDKYIISTIGGMEPVRTARAEGSAAAAQFLNGFDDSYRQKMRSEVLHTTAEDLRKAADAIDAVCKNAAVVVIGGAEKLAECGEQLDVIEALQN